jgi:hypothetical protein
MRHVEARALPASQHRVPLTRSRGGVNDHLRRNRLGALTFSRTERTSTATGKRTGSLSGKTTTAAAEAKPPRYGWYGARRSDPAPRTLPCPRPLPRCVLSRRRPRAMLRAPVMDQIHKYTCQERGTKLVGLDYAKLLYTCPCGFSSCVLGSYILLPALS